MNKGVLMEHEVLRKLRSAMIKAGHDALVAFSQDNVTYTAGFLVPSHASNRFRRTITVLAGDQFAAQIVVNVEEHLARQRSRFTDIRAYNQFTQEAVDPRRCSAGSRRRSGANRDRARLHARAGLYPALRAAAARKIRSVPRTLLQCPNDQDG